MHPQKPTGAFALYAYCVGVVLTVLALWRNFSGHQSGGGPSFGAILIAALAYMLACGGMTFFLWRRHRHDPGKDVGRLQLALLLQGVTILVLLGTLLV